MSASTLVAAAVKYIETESAAVDALTAKVTDLTTQVATLSANQADPAKQLSDADIASLAAAIKTDADGNALPVSA